MLVFRLLIVSTISFFLSVGSFLKRLYTSAQECPRSYDKLRFDPRYGDKEKFLPQLLVAIWVCPKNFTLASQSRIRSAHKTLPNLQI
jgi:hypothetical protein